MQRVSRIAAVAAEFFDLPNSPRAFGIRRSAACSIVLALIASVAVIEFLESTVARIIQSLSKCVNLLVE